LNRIAACLLYLFIGFPHSVCAQGSGISIDSFRVTKITPDIADIELFGSNDGSMGSICIGTIAKSKDGYVRSNRFPPIAFPVGQNVNIFSQVFRPDGHGVVNTDYLVIMVYQCGKEIFQRLKFDWAYEWPKKLASPTDTDLATQKIDFDSVRPYMVIYENFAEEDYAALDLILQRWNNPQERDSNGEWKLDSFRSVFLNYSSENRNWKADFKRIQNWRKFNPTSAGAAIAEAKYWIAYAWHIRGCECNDSVDPVAIRVFGERMKRAENILKNSKSFASINPLWYEAYLDIAVSTKRNAKFTVELFTEGIRRHPHFHPLYTEMVKYWSPKYGGKVDWEKVDKVVNQAVSVTADLDGGINYAIIYSRLDNLQKLEFDLFKDSLASWPRMKVAYEELINRYPSNENINEFATYACRASDKATYLNLRARMKDNVVPSKWPSNYSMDMCDHRYMQES